MNKKLAKLALPLFIFWPFGSFLCALQNIKLKSSAIVIILFSMVFGYGFSFTDSSADSYRLAYVFSVFDFSSFDSIIELYKAGDSTDVYRLLVYGVTKIFSNNPKVLYSLCGLVFGIFMYLSLRLFVNEKGEKNDLYIILLTVFFFSLNPLSNLNGFRFWTATWVFFYSVINFSFYNNKKWIIGIIVTPLIHFSFLFIMPVIIAFTFFKGLLYTKRNITKGLLVLFVFAFMVSWVLDTNVISLGFLAEQDVLSDSVSNKVELYNSDRVTEQINERGKTLFHTVNRIFSYFLKIYIFLFILKIRKIIKNNPDEQSLKLLAFVIVFTSFGYIATVIPSGGRFQTIAYLAAVLLFLRMYVKSPSIQLQKFILWGFPAFAFNIFFVIGYIGFTVVSSTVWFGNLFWIINEGLGFEVDYFL